MGKLEFSNKNFILSLVIVVGSLTTLHFWGMNIITSPETASYDGRNSDFRCFIIGLLGLAYGLTGTIFEILKPFLPNDLDEVWTKDIYKVLFSNNKKN